MRDTVDRTHWQRDGSTSCVVHAGEPSACRLETALRARLPAAIAAGTAGPTGSADADAGTGTGSGTGGHGVGVTAGEDEPPLLVLDATRARYPEAMAIGVLIDDRSVLVGLRTHGPRIASRRAVQ
ncbi:hypothetical protein ABZ442_14770 [Streptomyces triculaminicus]|uniref:hypothetical protein n=1 Tax=Streptomyces triculaminicus TaxID=2816232 RepID=UPI00340F73AA